MDLLPSTVQVGSLSMVNSLSQVWPVALIFCVSVYPHSHRVLSVASWIRTRRRSYGLPSPKAMACSLYNLSPGSSAYLARKKFYTIFCAGRLCGNRTLIPAMTFGRDDFLYSQNFATDRTVTTLGQACAFTSGFYRCVNCYGVRYPVNRFCLCRAAYHAGIGLDAFRFAGGLCCNYTIIPGMRQKSNGFFLCVAAAGAGTGFLSLLSTGSRLRLNPGSITVT